MKTLNESFTDEEFAELKKAKGKLSWHSYILLFIKMKESFPWDVICNIGHPIFPADEKRLKDWSLKYLFREDNKP